ncbi:tRNA1(Val) (adenine(37)-N6)-methyltransferase [Magnetofaba australis]|uniref:tRNA1(Val) (adenine(37)-N6)-methyltransferase n=1 Tax=Magnetofaba australis TaxID=1472297 RepID=UPI000A19DC42|nr:methyltransferase [Magnetofaba australis]
MTHRAVVGTAEALRLAAWGAARWAEADAPVLAELGCGAGDLSLALAQQLPRAHIDALEIQSALAALARQRVQAAALAPRLRIVSGDVRRLPPEMTPGAYDGVLLNPPYFAAQAARPCADPTRDAARRELHGDLGDFLAAARTLLKADGAGCIIIRWERRAELLDRLQQVGLGARLLTPLQGGGQKDPAPRWLQVEFSADKNVQMIINAGEIL